MKLSGATGTTEEIDPIQGDMDKLEKCAYKNLKFNKSRLHLARSNARCESRLGEELAESNHAEKDLGSSLAAQKASDILGCIKRGVVSKLR